MTSRLSPRDEAILTMVTRFRQVSSGHILRVFFADNSPASRRPRMTRTMARLHRWGLVNRIPRPIGGYAAGSAAFIYLPPTSKARTHDPHTLDIVELYVSLVEREREEAVKVLAFDPEAWAYEKVGSTELKPDAYVRLALGDEVVEYYIEVDRGSEWRHQLSTKMARYSRAYKRWPVDQTFPLTVWVVPDEQRKRLMEGVVKRQEYPELFMTVVTGRAAATLVYSGAAAGDTVNSRL